MTDRRGVRQQVSLPPGAVAERHVDERRKAGAVLPGPLREMVLRTAEPFIQMVVDVEVPRMRWGRVCLIAEGPEAGDG